MKSIFSFPFAATLCVLMLMLLAGCMVGKKAEEFGSSISRQEVPQAVAVLPVDFSEALGVDNATEINPEDMEFVGNLARGVLQSHLTGKGYRPLLTDAVDRKLHMTPGWQNMKPQELCRLLDAQGLILLQVSGWTMLNIAAVENFMFSATARMLGASGQEIGAWSRTADKHRFSIITSLPGVAGTVAGSMLGDPMKKQFRHVVYDWGLEMAQAIPDCPEGTRLPAIILVDSNVDMGLFGAGDQISVRLQAEKNVAAFFDIGTFRSNIPMRMTGPGRYEGHYVVREGDNATNQELAVRVVRPNGAERQWIEAEAPLTIDGVAPSAPEPTAVAAQRDGVHLHWSLPDEEEILSFVVERNTSPVGRFQRIVQTENATAVDNGVEQGTTYFYRIRSVDRAYNLSIPGSPLEVVMPLFDEAVIGGELSGPLITGNYFLRDDSVVPSGRTLTVMQGSRLRFAPDTGLDVQGRVVMQGGEDAPIILRGAGWRGLVVAADAEANLTHVQFRGASSAVRSSGRLSARDVLAQGNGTGCAMKLDEDGAFKLSNVYLSGWSCALAVEGGQGSVTDSTLAGNELGVRFTAGRLSLRQNNIHDNTMNVDAARQLVLRENYLGAAAPFAARVSRSVILQSILDAPAPHGRIITLMEEEDLDAETITARAEEHKKLGFRLFNDRKYGDALAELARAASLRADRDVALYLAYTQMELGEAALAEKTLKAALESFPYDYRLHQIYVRLLLGHGQVDEASDVVNRALTMDPDNIALKHLRDYVQSAARPAEEGVAESPQQTE